MTIQDVFKRAANCDSKNLCFISLRKLPNPIDIIKHSELVTKEYIKGPGLIEIGVSFLKQYKRN